MKVVVMSGSPRANGVSEKVVQQVIAGAKAAGHEVVTYNINQMEVHGCLGCGYCRANNADCCQKDDMVPYFEDLHTCGALVVTSPNYYSQIVGPMITFMNRHYCMTTADHKTRLTPGVKLVGIFVQGAPESYEKYMDNYRWYMNTFLSKDMVEAGMLVVGGDSDLSPQGAIMQQAYQIGSSL